MLFEKSSWPFVGCKFKTWTTRYMFPHEAANSYQIFSLKMIINAN